LSRQSALDVRDPNAVGLIGLGEIGQVHAAAVRRSRSARLAAVADTVPDPLAPFEARGARGYSGADELIADPQVGTVCVCLPHYLHFPVAMAAIRVGLNELVEKPLAASLEQAQQIVDAAAAGSLRSPGPPRLRRCVCWTASTAPPRSCGREPRRWPARP
jgi:predicted dehydrogenase